MELKSLLLVISFLIISIVTFGQEEIELGTWKIKNGQLLESDSSDISLTTAQEYWLNVYELLPKSISNTYLNQVMLFTDGKMESIAGVYPLSDSLNNWRFELDTADIHFGSSDSIKIFTNLHSIVHEFGHLVTMNNTQIIPTEDIFEDEDEGFLTSYGYATPDSYLCQFVREFWPYKMLKKWNKIDYKTDWESKKRIRKLVRFYNKNNLRFVTDYSVESPEEDIAETWTFFILDAKPTGSDLLSQKILFFYRFPELVNMRNEFRSRIKTLPHNYLKNYMAIYRWV